MKETALRMQSKAISLQSNGPPKSGRQMDFSQIDQPEFSDPAAKKKNQSGQEALIDELNDPLKSR